MTKIIYACIARTDDMNIILNTLILGIVFLDINIPDVVLLRKYSHKKSNILEILKCDNFNVTDQKYYFRFSE